MRHQLIVRRSALLVVTAVAVFAVGSVSWATPIALINPGFEQPDLGKVDFWNNPGIVPGWEPTGPGQLFGDGDSGLDEWVPVDGTFGGYVLVLGSSNASNFGTTGTDPPIAQTTGHTVAVGEWYTVDFWAKDEFTADQNFGAQVFNQGRVQVTVSGPGGFLHQAVVGPFGGNADGGPGELLPFQIVTDPVPAGQGGGPLTISFQNVTTQFFPGTFPGYSWVYVDNVALSYAIPEPASLLLMLGGLSMVGLTRRRR